ncbi:MAG: hypothetical protein Kow0069_10520 [Promethearchaeota archaeon]
MKESSIRKVAARVSILIVVLSSAWGPAALQTWLELFKGSQPSDLNEDGRLDVPEVGLTSFSDFLFHGRDVNITAHQTFNVTTQPGTQTDEDSLSIYVGEGGTIRAANFTFTNVKAKNFTHDVELLNNIFQFSDPDIPLTYFQEIRIPFDCYVRDVSFYAQCVIPWQQGILARVWNVTIFNATTNFKFESPVPDRPVPDLWKWGDPYDETGFNFTAHWENFSFVGIDRPLLLNQTLVQDGEGVFFVAAQLFPGDGNIIYAASDDYGDGVDAGAAYVGSAIGPPYNVKAFFELNDPPLDFALRVSFAPLSGPKTLPEHVGMRVEASSVANVSNVPGKGALYLATPKQADALGVASFAVGSAWSDLKPGTLSYDATMVAQVAQPVDVDHFFQVNTTTSKVEWHLMAEPAYPGGAIAGTEGLLVLLPPEWTVGSVTNLTGGSPVPHPWFDVVVDGKGRWLRVHNASDGPWEIVCTSPLHDLQVDGIAVPAQFNVTDSFTYDAFVPGGPNGGWALLDSEAEGHVASSLVNGTTNSTDVGADLLFDDQRYAWFTSQEGNNSLQEVTLILNASFGGLEGVDPDLLNSLEVRLTHWLENYTYEYKVADDVNVSGNPWWEVDDKAPSTEDLNDWDFEFYEVNVTYDGDTGFATPINLNFTADWSPLVKPHNITDLEFYLVSNASDSPGVAVDLLLYNWTSGQWVNVTNNGWRLHNGFPLDPQPYTLTAYLKWSSIGKDLNVSCFFRNVSYGLSNWQNQLRARVNVSHTFPTHFSSTLWLDFSAIKYFVLYPTDAENLTVQFYNYTSGGWGDEYNLSLSKIDDVVDAFQFTGDIGDVFDFEGNEFAVRFHFVGYGPSPRQLRIDQLAYMLNYTVVTSYAWNSTWVSVAEQAVASRRVVTLRESLGNNATFHWVIQDATQVPGNYTIVTAWSNGTMVALNTSLVHVTGIETTLQVVAGASLVDGSLWVDPAPYVNDTTRVVTVKLVDDVFGQPVKGATIRAVDWPTGDLNFVERYRLTGDPADVGLYDVTLDTTGMDANDAGVPLNLSAEAEFYLPTWVNLTTRVLPLPTTMELASSTINVYENQTFDVGVMFQDAFHGQFVADAKVTWSLGSASGSLSRLLYQYNGRVDLNDANLPAGTYDLVVTATKPNFEDAAATMTVNVLPRAVTTLVLDAPFVGKEVVEGQIVTATATLTYENGTALGGQEVVFEFNLSTTAGAQVTRRSALTEESTGVASVAFSVPVGTRAMSVRAKYAGTTTVRPASSVASSVVTVVSREEVTRRELVRWATYLVVALGAVLASLVARRSRKVRREAKWAENASKLEDSMKVQHVLIIHKGVGTAIVSKDVGGEGLDPDLVSGFLQALTSFGSEITTRKAQAPKGKTKGFLLDYEAFKILLVDGTHVRVGLILDGAPTEFIRARLATFTEKFEERYGGALAAFKGNLEPFKDAGAMIDDLLGVSLIYPHQVNPAGLKTAKIGRMERTVVDIARTLSKERRYFFIATLLEYAMAGRKESKNQVLSAIFDLREAGVIVPVAL